MEYGKPAHAGKARDDNESDIVTALRAGGASVFLLDTPCDLLVGVNHGTHLVEVKMPLGPRGGGKDRHLTDAQETFRQGWKGSDLEILRTPAEAREWLKRKKKLRFSTI